MLKVRNLVIIQARMNSSRLPGKVMKIVNNRPIIHWQILRVQRSKLIDNLIVAISNNKSDDALEKYLLAAGIPVFRGNELDVYDRFRSALEIYPAETVIRLTADCPLVMPELIDQMLNSFNISKPDYLSNALVPTFPDGLDIEVFSARAFSRLESFDLTQIEREHVTLGLYERTEVFKVESFENSSDLGYERWTLDYMQDFEFISRIYHHFRGNELDFTFDEVLQYLEEYPDARNSLSSDFRNISLRKSRDQS